MLKLMQSPPLTAGAAGPGARPRAPPGTRGRERRPVSQHPGSSTLEILSPSCPPLFLVNALKAKEMGFGAFGFLNSVYRTGNPPEVVWGARPQLPLKAAAIRPGGAPRVARIVVVQRRERAMRPRISLCEEWSGPNISSEEPRSSSGVT